MDTFREFESDFVLAIVYARRPQSPERAQAVVMVVERLCYLKGTFKGCMHFRSRTLCVDQQASERSTQLHLGSRFSKRAGGYACERSLDTSAAFMHQRKSHPEHDAGRRQRDT